MPDLTGQDEPTARADLEQAGLEDGTIRRAPSTDQPAGVGDQHRSPGGTQQPEGSTVDLLLSSGAPKVTMPEVYGRPSRRGAMQQIQDAGLVPRTPSRLPDVRPGARRDGRKTSPQPGITVRKGSPVIISVYHFRPPTTSTTTRRRRDTTDDDTPSSARSEPDPERSAARRRARGGRSSEREISFASARSVAAALDPERYEVLPVTIGEDGAWSCSPASPSSRIRARTAGRAPAALLPGHERARDARRRRRRIARRASMSCFPRCTARSARTGRCRACSRRSDFPYVGSGVLGSSVAMDKDLCKNVLRGAGIGVAPSLTLRRRSRRSR